MQPMHTGSGGGIDLASDLTGPARSEWGTETSAAPQIGRASCRERVYGLV